MFGVGALTHTDLLSFLYILIPLIICSPFVTANTASSLDLSIEFQTSLTAHLLFPLSCLIGIINPYIFKIKLLLLFSKLALLTVFPISLSGTPNSSSSS